MLRLLKFCCLLAVAAAWPSNYNCDYACLSGLSAGGAFGNMGISNFGSSPTGANCEITTDIPTGGYTAGVAYIVTVTSTTALARKLGSSVAGFSASAIVNAVSKVTSSTHQWTATSDSSASFKALCGAGGSVDQMWVADTVTHSIEATTSSSASTTTEALTSTSAPTTTEMPTSSSASSSSSSPSISTTTEALTSASASTSMETSISSSISTTTEALTSTSASTSMETSTSSSIPTTTEAPTSTLASTTTGTRTSSSGSTTAEAPTSTSAPTTTDTPTSTSAPTTTQAPTSTSVAPTSASSQSATSPTTTEATETISGSMSFTSTNLTKNVIETAATKSLANKFSVPESQVGVTAIEARRLEKGAQTRMLASTWTVSFTISVASSQAAAAVNTASSFQSDTTDFNQAMKMNLQDLGISEADATITVTSFEAVLVTTMTSSQRAESVTSGTDSIGFCRVILTLMSMISFS